MTNLSAAVAISLMRSLSENIAARRARVGLYHELLGNTDGVELIPHGAGSACLTQVIRVLPKRRDDDLASQLISALGAAGYEVRGSYVPIHLLPQFDRCVWDRLPYAERVWPDLVELPCEPSVSMDDMERIAMIVKKITSGR
jgi:dTDP-4-amino-4,6-dideoxygalactose transaminase